MNVLATTAASSFNRSVGLFSFITRLRNQDRRPALFWGVNTAYIGSRLPTFRHILYT